MADGEDAELLLALVGGLVLDGEPGFVEVLAARVRAPDALPLGPALPLAHGRVIHPHVLVHAEVPLAGFRLGFCEQDQELLVLVAPEDEALIGDVGLVALLLLHIDEGLPVALVALALVERLEHGDHGGLGEGRVRGDRRRGGQAGEEQGGEPHPAWPMAVTGLSFAARSAG